MGFPFPRFIGGGCWRWWGCCGRVALDGRACVQDGDWVGGWGGSGLG